VQEAPPSAPAKFVNFPFAYHQELEVTIEKLTNRGWGVARVALPDEQQQQANDSDNSNHEDDNNHSKWVVLVPNVIPGERVRIRVFRNFANYSEADRLAILEPSPDRVEPVCPLAADCGGCQLQHWALPRQRAWKADVVREALQQYGLLQRLEDDDVQVAPCAGTKHITGYRSKLTPHFNAPERRRRGGPTTTDSSNHKMKMIQQIGFQRQTSRQLVDVPSCPIATPEVNARYQQVRAQLLAEPWKSRKGATLLFRQDNLSSGSNSSSNNSDRSVVVTTDHKEFLTTTVRGLHFTYQAGNFFQNNYHVLPLLVDQVVEHAAAPTTDFRNSRPTNMTHLVDCYCGSGLFALSAASQFDSVVGIEINDKAVREATANAVANNITNCEFRAATAEAMFHDSSLHQHRDTTTVIIDPPRKGCSPDFLEQLCAFGPRRIVYVSCDPTTQARDAQRLVQGDGGYYRIAAPVQPWDLFPQTRHIECLMVLERK